MIDTNPLVLTEKQRQRMLKIREQLANGENPYSKLDTLTVGIKLDHPTAIKEISREAKMAKWLSTKSAKKGKVKFKLDSTPKGAVCMRCGSDVEVCTSSKISKLNGFSEIESLEVREVLHGVFAEVPVVKYIPRFKKGRVCSACLSPKDTIIHEDSDYV